MTILDAKKTRPLEGGPSFPLRHRLLRAAWTVAWCALASWSPPAMRPWRRFLLRLFGATLGAKADVRGSARVWYPPNLVMGEGSLLAGGVICYNMATVTLGRGALVSQRAHLCAGTHDYDDPDFQLVAKPITLSSMCWVAAEAFVGPGVTVGEGAVLGARAVARSDLAPWTVYAGDPAVPIKTRRVRQR